MNNILEQYSKLSPPEKVNLILAPQPIPSFANLACIECGEWSASGGLRCEDCQEEMELE